MQALFREIWESNRKTFLQILCLNILAALLSGIGIVMLIPLLHLLEIGAADESFFSALAVKFLSRFPYAGQVTAMLGVYIVLVAVKALLGRTLSIRENAFVENTNFRLRMQLYKAMSHASWEKLSAQRDTDAMNLFISQCGQVSYGIDAIIHLICGALSAVIQLCIALWMNAPMTLAVCGFGFVMVSVFLPLRKKSQEYGEEMIRINRDFYSELQNQLAGVKEVRAYGVEKEHAERFRQTGTEFRDASMRYVRMMSVPGVAYSMASACIIAGVYLLSTLVLHIPTDRLVVLVYIFMRLWPFFSGLQGQVQNIYSCVPAYEKLHKEIETMQSDAEHGEKCTADEDVFASWRRCRFENVSFAYSDADRETLKNISFSIECGKVTAVLGRNGAGKTTAINLLLGFLQPTAGKITVDGTPLCSENIVRWRRQVGYVPQEPLILNASVRENLVRFHPEATDEELRDALKTAMAWDFVSGLPQKMETQLGDRGIRLSGGERQRIVLARALIGRPRLMVLDEATSALDYESENSFRQVVQSMGRDIAVIVIAHRLATVRMADRAVVIQDGTVAEEGAVEELMKKYGGYLAGMLEEES